MTPRRAQSSYSHHPSRSWTVEERVVAGALALIVLILFAMAVCA